MLHFKLRVKSYLARMEEVEVVAWLINVKDDFLIRERVRMQILLQLNHLVGRQRREAPYLDTSNRRRVLPAYSLSQIAEYFSNVTEIDGHYARLLVRLIRRVKLYGLAEIVVEILVAHINIVV